MEKLKKKVSVGLVGGSDLTKILEQIGGTTGKSTAHAVFYWFNILSTLSFAKV